MAGWRVAEKKAAQKAVDFFEQKLCHFEGEHAGRPFRLEPWQEWLIRRLFGRLRKDGFRRYRTLYLEVPRKNGKSTLLGGITLYLLLEDNEPGAQVFAAAVDRAQAKIVFRHARLMAERSPFLCDRVMTFQNSIETKDGECVFRVLSADADSQHGLNVHGAVIDELHTQPDRELWDVLRTGSGARRQPLCVAITTAGWDRHSICWEQHEYARKVLSGAIKDDSYLAEIYAADEDDDWTDPATWAKANPNLGVSIKEEYLAEQCKEAQHSPAFENTFRQLHLNQWTKQASRFLPMSKWHAMTREVREEELAGRPCFAGLDLSSSQDVTAWVMVFPPVEGNQYQVLARFFLPEEGIVERSRREGVPYDQWARDGYLTLTPGEVVDYPMVRTQIEEDRKRFDVREIAFDRWGATQISHELDALGAVVIPFGQGFASMSPPTKELLSLVIAERLVHGCNPVLTWMAECVTVAQDAAGNIKPVKPDRRKNSTRIDGIVALVMGLARATLHTASTVVGATKGRSTYEERGLIII